MSAMLLTFSWGAGTQGQVSGRAAEVVQETEYLKDLEQETEKPSKESEKGTEKPSKESEKETEKPLKESEKGTEKPSKEPEKPSKESEGETDDFLGASKGAEIIVDVKAEPYEEIPIEIPDSTLGPAVGDKGDKLPVKQQETVLKNVRKAPKGQGDWITRKGKYYFRLKDGTYVGNTWLKIKKKFYYFDEEGCRRTQGFFDYANGHRYYLLKDGSMATKWQKIKKYDYYFGKNGILRTSQWVKTKGKYYYVNSKGRRQRSRWIALNGKEYYLDKNGVRVTGDVYIDGKRCHFDKNGVFQPEPKPDPKPNPQPNPDPGIDVNGKMVALTFDSGPSDYTERLLQSLQKNRAKATFFLVGSRLEYYPETVKKIASLGYEIGNLTWSHPELTKLSDKEIQSEIQKTNRQLLKLTGKCPTLLRPPYGEYNSKVAALADMPMIFWSVDTRDWETQDAKKTVDAVMRDVKDGSVVLLHDLYSETADAVEILIPKLQQAGYQLVTVSELAKYRGIEMKKGSAYYAFYK